ncbi:hypothetical protein, partial [Bacillus thuringiensis]|uniref:hypothetical protein n=1 Tax=Bacillus thuringiensis TaxID=1428 RepID=UPI002175ED30
SLNKCTNVTNKIEYIYTNLKNGGDFLIENRIVNGRCETGALSPFIVKIPSFVSINSFNSLLVFTALNYLEV